MAVVKQSVDQALQVAEFLGLNDPYSIVPPWAPHAAMRGDS